MKEQNILNHSSLVPEIVCLGHFCHDLHEESYILGGSAAYCSLLFQSFGKQTAVLTSVGADFKFLETFAEAGVLVVNKIAPKTTIFRNVYDVNKERTQYMDARAATLSLEDIPVAWKKAPLVKLCLIADELAPSALQAFPDAIIGATIQGWLRKWNEQGKIAPKEMDWALLKLIDVALFSENDIIGFEDKLPIITQNVKVAVMTQGEKGATVFFNNQSIQLPAFPVKEIDPTGAGDVFATTFFYYYAESKDVYKATAYAHAAASYVVEGIGIKLPTKEVIEQRFLAYQQLFSLPQEN